MPKTYKVREPLRELGALLAGLFLISFALFLWNDFYGSTTRVWPWWGWLIPLTISGCGIFCLQYAYILTKGVLFIDFEAGTMSFVTSNALHETVRISKLRRMNRDDREWSWGNTAFNVKERKVELQISTDEKSYKVKFWNENKCNSAMAFMRTHIFGY